MIDILAGIIIIVMLGVLVSYQLRSSRVMPNAQLLFDISQEMGEEERFDHQKGANKRTVKQNMKGV